MQKSKLKSVMRISAYVIGSLFIAFGIMGLIAELSEGKESSTIVAGYMMAAVFIIWGTLLCLAVGLHYSGGAWSFSGVILVGCAMIFAGFSFDAHLKSGRAISSIDSSLIATLWVVGCYCLAWGHMRRRQKLPANNVLQPTATAPSVLTDK